MGSMTLVELSDALSAIDDLAIPGYLRNQDLLQGTGVETPPLQVRNYLILQRQSNMDGSEQAVHLISIPLPAESFFQSLTAW